MEDVMAKIKHIALSTQDPDKTARFQHRRVRDEGDREDQQSQRERTT
jgi:hypothetical protein